MARPALDDGFGKVTKGTCDFCAQEADAELADCVSLKCRLGEKCHGEGQECDIYHRACIDKFMRSHCRLIDIERTCGWPCPKGKGKIEGHSCTGKVQWMKPLIIKHQKQAKAAAQLSMAAVQARQPAPKPVPKPKLNAGPIKRAQAQPQQIRFTPIIEQPKPDPLGRKLGSKDVEGPAELPPGMVLAGSEAAAAKAAKAAKKNAKRNAKKKVAGEGGDGRSEAGSQSLSSEALQQLPDAPRRIDPEHAAHMGGSAFIMDPQAYLRMLGMDSDDVSGDEDDDDHDVGGRGGYDMAQGMAQAISPASDDHGWVSAGAGAAGARLGEASLRRLQAQQQHPLQLGGLVHAVEEEESGADTASLDAALQVSLDVQQRHAELAAQEEADMAAALEASRQAAAAEASRRQQLQQQLWQADAWTPQVPAVAAEEAADEEAAVAAALAASLAEENRRLEEIRMAEASYAAARAAERQQEEAARAAALRAQQEAAREAALAAALQPTYATSLPAPTVPYPSAAPVVATAAGQLQTAGGYFPMPAKSPVAATGSLPWLVPVLGPSVTAAPAPAPASGYPMAAPIVGGAGCGEEEEDDDLDLEELKGLLVGAC